MSRKGKSGKTVKTAADMPFQDLPEGTLPTPHGYLPLVFSDILELGVVIFVILYSLFCLDGYLLDLGGMRLSAVNLSLLLLAEILVIGYLGYKKTRIETDLRAPLFAILIFLMLFIVSWNISPSFLPVSTSSDYPHHYILIEYFSVHEAFPPINYGIGEMVQYPFGASLFTSVIARIFSLPLMTAMGLLVIIMSGLIASVVYLISRELLRKCKIEKKLADMTGLVSAFMVFTMPVYFLDQYCGNFYYSMIFGELLVLISLLALMKSETGNGLWMVIFMLVNIGIIYTYTLFIVIPFLAFLLFAILNRNKIPVLSDKKIIISGLFVFFLFLLFSIQRLSVGTHILQHEGLTVEFSIFNFNILFIILVISGCILFLKNRSVNLRSAVSVYLFVIVLEYFGFIFLDYFGIIAVYFANKVFYILVLVVSVVTVLPVLFVIRRIQNVRHRAIAAAGITCMIGFFSVYSLLTYPVAPQPVVSNEDVIFTKNVEIYLHKNNISYDNLSITSGTLKGYWFGLLLHMDKNYAGQRFLAKPTAFNDWLRNPDSRFVVGEMTNASYPKYFSIYDVKLEIVVREGRRVLLKKVT